LLYKNYYPIKMENYYEKWIANISSAVIFLSLLSGCKGDGNPTPTPPQTNDHVCSFTQEVVNDTYLKKSATCTTSATYYYSCTCGEKGKDFFPYGGPNGHQGGTATETKKAVCLVCGQEYGDLLAHSHNYNQKIAQAEYLASEATCSTKATYYFSCVCKESEKDDTHTFEYGTFRQHDFTGDWQANENEHWHECAFDDCTEIDEKIPHTGGTATETEKAVCETCKTPYGDFGTHVHVFDQQVANDTYKKADATCSTKATYYFSCVCKESEKDDTHTFEYGTFRQHDFTGDWQANENEHWHECAFDDCTEIDEKISHTGGVATETEKAVCETCKTPYGDFGTHVHVFDQQVAEDAYKKADATCSTKATYYFSCACKESEKDDTHTFEYGTFRQHDFTGDWQADENEHWHECAFDDCTEIDEKIPHTGGVATATKQASCEVCGAEYGDYLDYSYKIAFAQDSQWVILNNDAYNKTIACTVWKNSAVDSSAQPQFTFADPSIARLDGTTLIGLKAGVTTLTAEYKGQTDTMQIEVLEALGQQVTATNPAQVKSFGRAYPTGTNNERLRFINTASGFEVNFIGTAVTCYINFDVYEALSNGRMGGLKIYLDGEPFYYYKSAVDANGVAITLVGPVENGFHTLKVLKMTEQALAQCEIWGLTTDGTFVSPFAHKDLLFEFYGDSITCGYGNLPDSEGMIYDQDGTNTYASIASEYFGAEYECVSYSGMAVAIPNGTVSYTVQDIFDRYHEQKRDVYDMSQTDPDVVIVSLGTNDSFSMGTGGNGALIKKYVEFIKALRAKRPNAPILCIYGLMWTGGNELETENCIKLAVEQLRQEGVEKVYYSRVEANITGKDAHPDAEGHQLAAQQLIELIKQYGELDGKLLTSPELSDNASITYNSSALENVRLGDIVSVPTATAKDYDDTDISNTIQIDVGYCDENGNVLQWLDSYMQADSPAKTLTVKDYKNWIIRYRVTGANENTVVKTLHFTASQSATPIVNVSNTNDIVVNVGSSFVIPTATATCNGTDVSQNIQVWIYRLVNGNRELLEILSAGVEAQLTHGEYELVYVCKDDLGNSSAEKVVNVTVNRFSTGTQLISPPSIAKNSENAVWNDTTKTLDVGVTSSSTNVSYSQMTFNNDRYGANDIIKVTLTVDPFASLGGEQFYTMGSYGSKTYYQYMPGGHEATWPPFFSIRFNSEHVGLVTGQLNLSNAPYVEKNYNLADGNKHTIAWQIVKTGANCDAVDASIIMRCWIDCDPTQANPSLEAVCTAENYEKYYFDRYYNEGDGWLYFGSISTTAKDENDQTYTADDCMHIHAIELC